MATCVTCRQQGRSHEALACDECKRAIALQWWGAVARHEQDATCVLCEQGEAAYCPEHFFEEVVEHRRRIQGMGGQIGELLGLAETSVPLRSFTLSGAEQRAVSGLLSTLRRRGYDDVALDRVLLDLEGRLLAEELSRDR
jgi:hypothetical protein